MVNPMNLHGSKSQKSLCACRKKSSNSGTCSGKLRCKSRSCRGAFGDFAGTTRLSAVTRIVFGQPAPWSDFIAACANKPRAETRRASLLITDPNQWRTGHPGRVPPRVRNAHPIMANVTLRTARVAGAATGSGIHALCSVSSVRKLISWIRHRVAARQQDGGGRHHHAMPFHGPLSVYRHFRSSPHFKATVFNACTQTRGKSCAVSRAP
jgi:hypothetical protein